MLAVPLFALLALLAACAGTPGSGDAAGGDATGDATGTPPSAPAGEDGPTAGGGDDDLVIEIDRGDGSPVQRYTLACGGSTPGDLPGAEAACAHLTGMAEPFAPVPADAVCTEQYGGPQTARITGRWHGQPVDLELSRVDGCRISQWDGLGPLLPGPVGVEAPPS
ncbi:SSI family serine proteinase inhibitor [Geodermatophilus sp. YIM 151500]|uniref:SSI family serine proteinase inhibitor n=1 Tax=Geodermatophilus sp. YIM 151500 TaxID=2984531 RepID=UPI0021E3BB60|nr:SSI family serine proteinase inhibitor [Geodermatophilus sp. YIM 151500]MCV2491492.1 SSI family serine proteinase inhibitor [Geodermatophilus sp. YIM 151500]